MEEKILRVLDQLLEGQEEIKNDITVLKNDVTVLKNDVTVLKNDVTVLKNDVTVLKNDVTVLKNDITVLKSDVTVLKSDVTMIKMTLDNEIKVEIRALFDAREVQKDVNKRILNELDQIKGKVDRLQLETAHVRVVK